MKIIQKFIINHKFNKSTSQMIFYMVISIMIFMHTIVSVNTTVTGSKMAETVTTTLTKTLFDLSKNPIIAQQSSKTSTQIPTTSSSASSSSSSSTPSSTTLASYSTLYSNNLSSTTTIAPAIAADIGAFKTPHINDVPAAKDNKMGVCKSLTDAWGDVDPNIFYICDTNTKKPVLLRCPQGRGFFMGFGYSGCIPFKEWPTCVSGGHLEQVVVCDSEHMQQPWETMNPNKFYVCLEETIEPIMLNCEQGKGFVHAFVSTRSGGGGGNDGNGVISEIVGCANWEKWRSYMQCNDYY